MKFFRKTLSPLSLIFKTLLPTKKQTYPAGCGYAGPVWPQWVYPDGSENPGDTECYTHDSLVTAQADCNLGDTGDSCDRGIDGLPSMMAWAYYAEPTTTEAGPTSIWDAQAFIPEVCYGENGTYNYLACGPGPSGNSTEWSHHIRYPQGPVPYNPTQNYSYAPVLDDILACKLPAVSWVIPDGSYSDHPPSNPTATSISIGPSWVADIVDAIGNSQGNGCGIDYWGYGTPAGITAQPTAIFVVWDDWGGWFDHVKPWIARIDKENPTPPGYTPCDPTTQWGCGYTDGFRVPLLVVSPYTTAGYVSGECGVTNYPACGDSHNQPPQYVHDFGSILAYIEWNFGMPPIAPPGYADANAPDGNGNTPLSDFFPLPVGQGRSFTSITTTWGYWCFQNPNQGECFGANWVPTDPDDY